MSQKVRTETAAEAVATAADRSSSGDEQCHSLASFTEETSVLTKTFEERFGRHLAVEVEKPRCQLSEAQRTL